jgi:hypothetical protein
VVLVGQAGSATIYGHLIARTMARASKPSGKQDVTKTFTLEIGRLIPQGLYVDANISFENGKDDSVEIGTTLLELKLPCEPGMTWRAGRLTYKDGFTLRPEARVEGVETVQTPAGTFGDCLKIAGVCPNGVEGYFNQENQRLEILSSEARFTTWYYPQIGIVKEEMNSTMRVRPEGQERAAILRIITHQVTELTEYELAKR